ncbi:cold shock domain-containing protein [Nocardia sp. NPDC004568]|uniref:cold shock domain-containing protein n=1 Tax=Nocardia sp. NPDC004568 TaxID=3154551 RepID=UPI0033AED64B
MTAPASPRLEDYPGAAQPRAATERSSVRFGRVIWYDAQKGFGYIDPDDDIAPVFVEYRSIDADGYRVLFADQRVEFSTVARAGGAEAVAVRLCD